MIAARHDDDDDDDISIETNQTLNADLHFQQLKHMHENIRKRIALVDRRNVVLLKDDAKLHSARITHRERNIGFRLINHIQWDIVQSDFHLFCS